MSFDVLRAGLRAPICLTWELTYACNLRCRHCLSASGTAVPRELTTAEACRVIDELAELHVFYVNVGGGEPMLRDDFVTLMEYAIHRQVGVKVSTNGSCLDERMADWIRDMPYFDVQISIDGATPAANDAIRGTGAFDLALAAMDRLAVRGIPILGQQRRDTEQRRRARRA